MKRALVLCALVVAGCASPMIANEDQYAINTMSLKFAGQVATDAEAHCAQYGKRSVLRSVEKATYIFDCVSAPKEAE